MGEVGGDWGVVRSVSVFILLLGLFLSGVVLRSESGVAVGLNGGMCNKGGKSSVVILKLSASVPAPHNDARDRRTWQYLGCDMVIMMG